MLRCAFALTGNGEGDGDKDGSGDGDGDGIGRCAAHAARFPVAIATNLIKSYNSNCPQAGHSCCVLKKLRCGAAAAVVAATVAARTRTRHRSCHSNSNCSSSSSSGTIRSVTRLNSIRFGLRIFSPLSSSPSHSSFPFCSSQCHGVCYVGQQLCPSAHCPAVHFHAPL